MNLFLDIETIPREDPSDDEVKACSRCKKEDSIQKDFDENYETLLQAALKKKGLGYFDCRIVCISYAFENEKIRSITGTEEEIMKGFELAIKENVEVYTEIALVGFNIKGFDAPVLYLRACLYNCDNAKCSLLYGRKKMVDIQDLASYWNYKVYPSLKNTAKFFGLEGKGDIDGSMVYPMFKEGKIKEIAEYCRGDVRITRELYNILHV